MPRPEMPGDRPGTRAAGNERQHCQFRGRCFRPERAARPDAHGGDATTLAIAGFPQPALGPAAAATRQPAAQASPARLRVPTRRPGTYGVLL